MVRTYIVLGTAICALYIWLSLEGSDLLHIFATGRTGHQSGAIYHK
jgi:hypothetical protein